MKTTKQQLVSQIRKTNPDPLLRFSFQLFHSQDTEICPPTFPDGYTQKLMERLCDLSTWTVRRFTGAQDKSLRNHQHEWERTSRKDGFSHLNEHYSAYPGWQFCLSANKYGRVHGIIIDDTFYVIWLDQQHNLYP
jgi:hypothetical protein